jgi:aspartyl-tRNA(Asn)/glutamyl-tRNA(Gln) amidotransferase subunit A
MLRRREIGSEELVHHFADRIDKQQDLNAFITVDTDYALQQARAADQLLAGGNPPPLAGLPIAHKDIFCTQGMLTTCGSKMLANFLSPYDATVVRRLKDAGAVTLGKTNMDEFAMGSSNETSHFGPVHNPWNRDRVPGGSSGGSAAAVAARLVSAATGTDTGGSIRQPASFCGLTGLKPTYGRVSRYGMVAYASSLDQGGPITQTAEDAALLLQTMAGFDARDSTLTHQYLTMRHH